MLIIGCGAIAGGYDADASEGAAPLTHASAFSRNPKFQLVACVDPDKSKRDRFAARWRVGTAVAALEELGSERFDVVSICSPTHLHAEHVEAALAVRPKLIFCEKPVTPTSAETERLSRLCEEAGVLLAVNYTRRWAPDVVAHARALKEGRYGALRSVAAVYGKGLLHNGSHMVDLLNMLLGPLRLIAAGRAQFDFWEDDPNVPALLENAAGVPVHLAHAHASDFALFELQLVTATGTIAMLDGGRLWIIRRPTDSSDFPGFRELGEVETLPGATAQAMSAAVANIAGALERDEPLASTAANALVAQRLCEAIRAAAKSPYQERSHP